MRTLIIPVGCPGMGKTYWCKRMLDEYGIKNVSSDQMREDLYGDARIQGDYHEVFNAVYDTICTLFDNGEDAVILDATNVTRHVRRKAIFDTDPTEIIYVIMPDGLDRALENNKNRDRAVPNKVIHKMYNSYKRDMPCEEYDFFNGIDCYICHLDDSADAASVYNCLKNVGK